MQLQLDLSFLILLQTFNSIQNGNERVYIFKTCPENLRQLSLKYDFDIIRMFIKKKKAFYSLRLLSFANRAGFERFLYWNWDTDLNSNSCHYI